jgi:undecaprenyl-diphosphatase
MWYRIAPILGGTCAGVADLARGRSPWQRAEFRWAAYVCIATVPAGALGVLFEDTLKAAFGSPTQTSWLLMVTGVILFATRFATSGAKDIGWFGSVVVGCAQACAILPGISRSGSTIAAGLFCGVDRQKAAEFSFLLSIPVILGGAGIHILEMVNEGGLAAVFNLPLISAFVTSAIFGYLAIRVLLSFVQTGRLHWFAYYCWGVGIAGTLYFA